MENNVEFILTGGELSDIEKQAYIARGREKYGRALEKVEVKLDGEYADIHYYTAKVPFERIRRITGYLVGTIDRWNNAKKSEEKDRVKHAV
ncbi:MAG: hypothetical protein IKR85_08205 [Clostridia bacterium]|nr:hypothetical protein [Clostridia bacterium]